LLQKVAFLFFFCTPSFSFIAVASRSLRGVSDVPCGLPLPLIFTCLFFSVGNVACTLFFPRENRAFYNLFRDFPPFSPPLTLAVSVSYYQAPFFSPADPPPFLRKIKYPPFLSCSLFFFFFHSLIMDLLFFPPPSAWTRSACPSPVRVFSSLFGSRKLFSPCYFSPLQPPSLFNHDAFSTNVASGFLLD